MPTITLGRPLIDYLTITSFDENFSDTARLIFHNLGHSINKRNVKESVKRMQYTGYETTKNALGTAFYGEGVQKGRFHAMMQISGELCNETDVINPIASGIREGWLSCRRIDLQVTVERPPEWAQWALFNRQKRAKRSVGWVESTSKAGNLLQTVYVGKRTSGKFLRVYEKEFAEEVLLRCEYELKGNYAEAYARALWRPAKGQDADTPGSLIKLLLFSTNDEPLSRVYLPSLEYFPKASKPKILVSASKTEKWLLDTVLPTFTRVINDHASDSEVLQAYQDAINLFYKRNGLDDKDIEVVL